MLGLFFLAVIVAWMIAAFVLPIWMFKKSQPPLRRRALKMVFAVCLMLSPVADELVGSVQFNWLCSKYGRKESQFSAMAGRTVLVTGYEYEPVANTILEVEAADVNYLDPETERVLATYSAFRSKGGWFIRTLGFSENDSPLMFESGCGGFGPESTQGWLRKYQIRTQFRNSGV